MQDQLKIERSHDTPEILFDPSTGLLSIRGRSLPEDASAFYEPVLAWLTEYSKFPTAKTQLIVNLEYFNTASAKQIFKIISLIKEVASKHDLFISWHYDAGDKDMQASGERFSKLSGVPFGYVQN